MDYVKFYCEITNKPHLPTLEAILIGRIDLTDLDDECDKAIACILEKYHYASGYKMHKVVERVIDKINIKTPISTTEVLDKIDEMIRVVCKSNVWDYESYNDEVHSGKVTIKELIDLYKKCN